MIYFFLDRVSLILKIKTNKHATNCKLITIIKTKSFKIKIPYNEVKNVVIVRTIYVVVFALGFFFQRSFIVGTKPKNVIIPPIL